MMQRKSIDLGKKETDCIKRDSSLGDLRCWLGSGWNQLYDSVGFR